MLGWWQWERKDAGLRMAHAKPLQVEGRLYNEVINTGWSQARLHAFSLSLPAAEEILNSFSKFQNRREENTKHAFSLDEQVAFFPFDIISSDFISDSFINAAVTCSVLQGVL